MSVSYERPRSRCPIFARRPPSPSRYHIMRPSRKLPASAPRVLRPLHDHYSLTPNADRVAQARRTVDRTDSRVQSALASAARATATHDPAEDEQIKEIARLAHNSYIAICEAYGELRDADDVDDRDRAKFEKHLDAVTERTNDAWVLSDLAMDKVGELEHAGALAARR
jgi:uncharacterized protein with von Willebrand factor type A (vWA) domain